MDSSTQLMRQMSIQMYDSEVDGDKPQDLYPSGRHAHLKPTNLQSSLYQTVSGISGQLDRMDSLASDDVPMWLPSSGSSTGSHAVGGQGPLVSDAVDKLPAPFTSPPGGRIRNISGAVHAQNASAMATVRGRGVVPASCAAPAAYNRAPWQQVHTANALQDASSMRCFDAAPMAPAMGVPAQLLPLGVVQHHQFVPVKQEPLVTGGCTNESSRNSELTSPFAVSASASPGSVSSRRTGRQCKPSKVRQVARGGVMKPARSCNASMAPMEAAVGDKLEERSKMDAGTVLLSARSVPAVGPAGAMPRSSRGRRIKMVNREGHSFEADTDGTAVTAAGPEMSEATRSSAVSTLALSAAANARVPWVELQEVRN